MSFISPALIDAVAQSIDIPQLSGEAAKALAPDVEYRLRELVQVCVQPCLTSCREWKNTDERDIFGRWQDAKKFARHSRRLKITTEDVNNALRMRNAEVGEGSKILLRLGFDGDLSDRLFPCTQPLYGFSRKDPYKYVKAAGQPDVYCLEDKEFSVEQLVEAPLPRPPVEVAIMPHWLFINGVQPVTPENAPLERPAVKKPRLQPIKVEAGPSAKPAGAKGAHAWRCMGRCLCLCLCARLCAHHHAHIMSQHNKRCLFCARPGGPHRALY